MFLLLIWIFFSCFAFLIIIKKSSKFEFKVTVHYMTYGNTAPSIDPLSKVMIKL